MNWTRQQLKTNAKLMFKKNYWLCVVVTLILALFGGDTDILTNRINSNLDLEQFIDNVANGQYGDAISWMLPLIGLGVLVIGILVIVFRIFIGNALAVGASRFFLHNIESKGELNDMTFGFANRFMSNVKTMFLKDLYVFLWSLLLVIPGIIKAYEYHLVPYLLAENPDLTTDEALYISKDMMNGEKWNTFVLELSFILWDILSAITWGLVGIFWVNPWKRATDAELYTAIKTRYAGARYTGE